MLYPFFLLQEFVDQDKEPIGGDECGHDSAKKLTASVSGEVTTSQVRASLPLDVADIFEHRFIEEQVTFLSSTIGKITEINIMISFFANLINKSVTFSLTY